MKIFKSNPSFIECVAVACGGVGLACCLFSAAVSLINYNRMIPIEPVSIWIYGVILIGGVMVSAAGLLLSAARFSTGQAPLVSKNIGNYSG